MTSLAFEVGLAPALSLARLLQDLAQPEGPFSAQYSARLDRLEMFPEAACKALDEFGLNRFYVPARHGGALGNFEDLVSLWRAVAQRDLTVAVAHGKTFLGAVCVWVGGDPTQAAWLAKEVCAGAVVAWGLTERGHGSDLLAGELTAQPEGEGWKLHGEKWLINNATRSHLICVLARTKPEGGPRGFSLFLVDKRRLAPGGYNCLPKEPTHGIRGADISGIAFQDALLPGGALVGRVGQGIEIVLKALQLTRTTCVALSLGAGDHALRLALDFAQEHRIYDRRLIDLPPAQATLGEAFAGLLVAEAVSLAASRSIHAFPGEMSVISAIAKSLIPTIADEMISRLGELLGSRAFLLDVYAGGMFQKLERDHRIVAIFDGSTVVNRHALINQFPALARAYRAGACNPATLAQAMTLADALPAVDPGSLRLAPETGCGMVQSLPFALRHARELGAQGAIPATIGFMLEEFHVAVETVIAEIENYTPTSRQAPAAAFTFAMRYELCFAGTVCLRLWLHNAGDTRLPRVPFLWKDALWLEAGLTFILSRLRPGWSAGRTEVYDQLANQLKAKGSGPEFSMFSRGWEGR